MAVSRWTASSSRTTGRKASKRRSARRSASRWRPRAAARRAAPPFTKKKSPLPFIGRALFLSRREGRFSAERGVRFDRGARVAVSRRDDFFGGFSRLDGLAGPGDMEAVIGAGCGGGPVCDTDQRHAETPQICVDLRLPRNVEMGGAFVEEQQFRLSIEARASNTRCFCPPDS